MKLYNTLTRQVEEIQPLDPPKAKVYTCGPTVYDYPHIGNWFTFIRYDILIRTLKAAGLTPDWVMNITDVGHLVSDADEGEDKLEKGARREGKTAWDIANFYTDYFLKTLDRLNMLQPDHLPRATALIPEQIALVQKLEEKGFAYTIDDGVYFDTSKLDDYGKLARLDIEHLKEGARVEENPQKRNATDFALWKFTPQGQKRDMEWDSPWGKGFPGWHLECSVMAMKYLGDTIDIHGGGIDHIPVHHTNEIAQSEAATGKPFAHYWFHSNFILVDGKKMSKSLDNFYTLEDIQAKGFDPMAFRLLVLESHYRTEANFSWENLQAASARLRYMRNNISWIYQSGVQANSPLQGLDESINKFKRKITDALQNDLDTPKALALLNDYIDGFATMPASRLDIPVIEDFANFIEDVLGLKVLVDKSLPKELEELLVERKKARETKDWVKSDRLREQLNEQGIEVKDTPHGQIWSRS